MATSVLWRTVLFVLMVAAVANRGNFVSAYDFVEGCPFNHLPCDDKECIPRKGWCDGFFDCSDGSDENYCRKKSPFDTLNNINNCDKDLHFQCDTGECIPKAARCDDLPDCTEKEDEENCDYYFEWSEDTDSKNVIITTEAAESVTPEVPTILPTTDSIIDSRTYPTLSLLSVPTSADALKNALRYVLNQRDKHWGWRNSTAKMIVAIHLANQSYFHSEGFEGHMSKKQLEVQLAIDLMKKEEMPVRLPELSHYIHALLVTCENPRDFHGVNLLKMLRRQINKRRHKKQFVSPLAYLALCNAGEVADGHIRRLKNMAYRRTEEPRWLDIQAYALLAISCYSKTNISSKEWKLLKKDVAKNLTDWQQADGSFGSIYSTGLVLQALIAAEELGTESAKGRAMIFLKLKQDWEGSFGSELNNFYILPALNLNSLAGIRNLQCKTVPVTTLNTGNEDLSRGKEMTSSLQSESPVTTSSNSKPGNWRHGKKKNRRKKGKLIVHYSLWIGGEKNEIHTVTLSVPPHSNFMEIMDAAERANPKYKHEVWVSTRGPVVQSIAGRSADVEKSLYWTLYRKVPLPFRPMLSNTTATTARLKLLGATKYIKDIRKLYPKDGEHLAFWLKAYF